MDISDGMSKNTGVKTQKSLREKTCDECKIDTNYIWLIQNGSTLLVKNSNKKQTTCFHLLASNEKGKTCEKMKTKRENLWENVNKKRKPVRTWKEKEKTCENMKRKGETL